MPYQSIVANVNPESGKKKIEWAKKHMPIMNQIVSEYDHMPYSQKPLFGLTVVTSVHLEAKTARLVQALAELGATVYATGCNPLSTQDDVATALSETPFVTVYAKHGCTEEDYWNYLRKALSHYPHIIIDDGGDLVSLLQDDLTDECQKYIKKLRGGCEETTTGIHRLKALSKNGRLKIPMIDVNDANCKHLFDNYYGTGQSVLDGILRTTNLIIAGKTVVVAGYGDCGSGIAKRMRGLDAKVIVTEVNPVKALKAHMDGFIVMTMEQAAPLGDIFVTATGCKDVITMKHIKLMKDGALLANAGHFNVEIDVHTLSQLGSKEEARNNIEAFQITKDHAVYLLADGRLVNLAAADGHAAEIMDMSFSIQLLSVIYIAKNFKKSTTKPLLYPVPPEIDDKVARLALEVNGIKIDELTKAQRAYLENGF